MTVVCGCVCPLWGGVGSLRLTGVRAACVQKRPLRRGVWVARGDIKPVAVIELLLFRSAAAGGAHAGHRRVGEPPATPRLGAAPRLGPALDLVPRAGHLLRPVAPVVLEEEVS